MTAETRKQTGAYFTPEHAVAALVRWAVRSPSDRMLDPSCGDGRFLVQHKNSVGVEHNSVSAAEAARRAPHAVVHERDFFKWAADTPDRFECAAGNPPFIRYQSFSGETRDRALSYCAALGASFTALTSSWAPFVVAAASLLKPGGRFAFVVPAEIGHAPYARPVLEYFLRKFSKTQLIAVRNKIFPELSEDVWLLYGEGFGGASREFRLTTLDRFEFMPTPPRRALRIPEERWNLWNGRLRPFLLPTEVLDRYQTAASSPDTRRLGDLARVGIGYVTGANDFFHLRPSLARALSIPPRYLQTAVRNGRMLKNALLTKRVVQGWIDDDEPVLLLRLPVNGGLPPAVARYLESREGELARLTYKCRNREPWYVVPDVYVPEAFMTYMNGHGPSLVVNAADCVGTNSVHTVRLKNGTTLPLLKKLWQSPIRELSCELEGHPLGGGMLKIEPGEAARILLGRPADWSCDDDVSIQKALDTLRLWRHCGTHGTS